jgi:pSer/pThr/pTyr-binding forkhead associated (FHA) protein
MVQLGVLTGSSAGLRKEFRSFPIAVGRARQNELVLSDPGVFEVHFQIQSTPEGFWIAAAPEAVTTVNDSRVDKGLLRNGDVIGAGYAKIQFWLGALQQRGLRLRESAAWLLVALTAAAQVYLLLRLLEMAR